ncbi:MAG: glycosyltransferase [Chlorobia bacterium]|nr:glycosyltransferase [Fimbriimonadaceae bacterium]
MSEVHLINPMRNPAGGSEHRTIALFELLSEVEAVQVWTEEDPDPAFLGKVPMRKIEAPARFPRGGNLVFVGTYFSVGAWIQAASPKRIILVHNLAQPERLRQVYHSLSKLNLSKVEIVYASEAISRATPDLPGVIHESPIELDRFSPSPSRPREFTIGRLSRDVPEKHHPDDPDLYRRLVEAGFQCRVMGGTALSITIEGVEILPENAVPASDFLASLDVFFYRTNPAWREAYGRVIFEAMACGLPVVAERGHGYENKLTDGHDAIFASTNEEAFDAIMTLRNNADLRQKLGQNARQMVEQLYGAEFRAKMQIFYAG